VRNEAHRVTQQITQLFSTFSSEFHFVFVAINIGEVEGRHALMAGQTLE